MIVKKVVDVSRNPAEMDGAKAVHKQVLISEADGAPNFRMRLFTVAPGGHTPCHEHPFEHEVFVLEGHGKLVTPAKEFPLEKEYVCLVPPNETHQFVNAGNEDFRIICLIPIN